MKSNIIVLLISLTLGLLICESAVRIIRPASDIFPANPVTDPILGHRLLPFQSGHDARGLRNNSAEGYFPVVCIGDSQIYGTSIPRHAAIPQQLGAIIKQPVYNMALGGYGPIQYYQLFLDSRKMKPLTTIIAIYLGNDLLDAYFMAIRHGYWKWLLKKIGDENELSIISRCSLPYEHSFQKVEYQDPETITTKMKEGGSIIYKIHAALRLHSALYALSYEGLVKPLIQRIFERSVHLQLPGAFYTPQVDTIFTPGIRLRVLDLKDERVRIGLLLTKRIIELMAESVKGKNELTFIFIPTKENVYYDFLRDKKIALPAEYECLVHYEREITKWLSKIITANGLGLVDIFPPLTKAVAEGEVLYHHSSDGHANAVGNRIIATSISRALPK